VLSSKLGLDTGYILLYFVIILQPYQINCRILLLLVHYSSLPCPGNSQMMWHPTFEAVYNKALIILKQKLKTKRFFCMELIGLMFS
jgi:hypothetical protein